MLGTTPKKRVAFSKWPSKSSKRDSVAIRITFTRSETTRKAYRCLERFRTVRNSLPEHWKFIGMDPKGRKRSMYCTSTCYLVLDSFSSCFFLFFARQALQVQQRDTHTLYQMGRLCEYLGDDAEAERLYLLAVGTKRSF